jgi:hypothetical protein
MFILMLQADFVASVSSAGVAVTGDKLSPMLM